MSGTRADRRSAGVLLHPSALPGPDDRGAFGAHARQFVDWLHAAGFAWWQVLPLGPVGPSRSPYWASSDNALNPEFIDWSEAPPADAARSAVEQFCQGNPWCERYALHAAISGELGGAAWQDWPEALRRRDPDALHAARQRLDAVMRRRCYEQWLLDTQWRALRGYAHQRGVRLFGDLPIYVAPDSEAVWSQPEQFLLDAGGHPARLAGVPPDYFSADGQLWGNPLYDWQQARIDRFAFWRARFALQLARYDLVRIDHFRGLESCWSVPQGAATARAGEWQTVPGAELLATLAREHGRLPVVAEDLGVITPEVDALRRAFHLPGMRVLQFGFDGSSANPHLPHNLPRDCVVYTGTHDNDTTVGWYRSLDEPARSYVDFLLRSDLVPMPEALLRAALYSVACLAIAPAQDLIGAGADARFNTPGTVGSNWLWRLPEGALDGRLAEWCRALLDGSGRL